MKLYIGYLLALLTLAAAIFLEMPVTSDEIEYRVDPCVVPFTDLDKWRQDTVVSMYSIRECDPKDISVYHILPDKGWYISRGCHNYKVTKKEAKRVSDSLNLVSMCKII